MRAVLFLAPAIARRLVDDWAGEHAGYYGLPCGQANIIQSDQPDWTSIAWTEPHPGWPGGPSGLARPAGTPLAIPLGHTVAGPRHSWVRSSRSWAALDLADDPVRPEVCGRRHAIHALLPDYVRVECLRWEIIASQRPDLAPWETTT
jgi:hypothetical protein